MNAPTLRATGDPLGAPAAPASHGASVFEHRFALAIAATLLASGFAHLGWLVATGAAWEGPTSLRKPGLFGLSGGITLLSLVWTLTRLEPSRYDRLAARLAAGALGLEVALITWQYWRGVPSHFNRATPLDATIETTMLALILGVTAFVAWLCVRSARLRPTTDAMAVAIRGGLWLLLASCLFGVATTILGEINLAVGRPPEVWGRAGVPKYPHGIALHALQTLPLFAAALDRLHAANAGRALRFAVAAHVALLVHASWQMFGGRARFDLDLVGGATLVAAGLLLTPAIAALAIGLGGRLVSAPASAEGRTMASSGRTTT